MGGGLGGVEGKEVVVRMYCMREEQILKRRRKENVFQLDLTEAFSQFEAPSSQITPVSVKLCLANTPSPVSKFCFKNRNDSLIFLIRMFKRRTHEWLKHIHAYHKKVNQITFTFKVTAVYNF